jgi:hypothetical protein
VSTLLSLIEIAVNPSMEAPQKRPVFDGFNKRQAASTLE